MKATEILEQEHALIQEVLNSLERGAQRLAAGEEVPADFFIDAAEFIRGFADGAHHKKEEGVLFKAMGRHGFSPEAGPVAVMLAEHDEARRHTQGLAESAQKLKGGDRGAGGDVSMYAMSYVRLLRQHIMKESGILFQMADSVIPRGEHAGIEAEFAQVERDQIGPAVHEKYQALARKLKGQMA
ncbi:MAG: hemerythrin domain-containing protein [Betaproteobacteria bacterium]|nr:hemerythrin domain-containing protein [Betaproteobacteria bacterium]